MNTVQRSEKKNEITVLLQYKHTWKIELRMHRTLSFFFFGAAHICCQVQNFALTTVMMVMGPIACT